VVVTGSAGFIGFWASLRLRERGDGVVGMDNFNDYYPVSIKHARAAELATAGVHTVRGDINNPFLLRQIFEICQPTHVLHLAAQAGVRYANVKPLKYIDANVHGTTVLLEAVRAQSRPPFFIYASSSSVYGGNTNIPFSETDRVDKPISLYAATKRTCELLASVYHGIAGISVSGLRFFTVYGPWGRPDMAALAFAHKISQGHPVKIFKGPGGVELARDFTYIDDIISGVLGAIDTAAPGQERIFNLGNTQPHTVSDFVTYLEKALGKKALRHYQDLPHLGDVLSTHSNISAAHKALGYEPHVSLEEGTKRFASWFYVYYGPGGDYLKPDEEAYQPMR
jgi:UDP-glucuronate 4-epimerase